MVELKMDEMDCGMKKNKEQGKSLRGKHSE